MAFVTPENRYVIATSLSTLFLSLSRSRGSWTTFETFYRGFDNVESNYGNNRVTMNKRTENRYHSWMELTGQLSN
jgi:hypothetical protein